MEIYKIQGLIANCFLIKQSDKLFLFDTGYLGLGKRIIKKIFHIGKNPSDLSLILVTHAHLDHFGGLFDVYHHSKAIIGCHEYEFKRTSMGSKKISPAISKAGQFVSGLASLSLPFIKSKRVLPHIKVKDGMSLEGFGLNAQVIHTPGHTKGHISIVLEERVAFTGDLIMGKTITNQKPHLGIFAENINEIYESWMKILKTGAKVFYPAHGRPFTASELEVAIEENI